MKFTVKHEGTGRIRIHLLHGAMKQVDPYPACPFMFNGEFHYLPPSSEAASLAALTASSTLTALSS